MGESYIPVDLFNPGQVFACLGFVEVADVLLGGAAGAFDWHGDPETKFQLKAAGNKCPVMSVLKFLDQATITAVATEGSSHSTGRKRISTVTDRSGVFPFPAPGKPATLPACLEAVGKRLIIDYWGDSSRRDRIKLWGGMGGYSGPQLVRDALNLVRGRLTDHVGDPFALSAEQRSSLRFDWRRDYVPINLGFSPNSHRKMIMQGYPVVEVLAAIGMTHARPFRMGQGKRLQYGYGVAGITGSELYDPIFLRAALGSKQRPFPGMRFRLFSMYLDWPGQENKERCITNVIEERPE